MGSEEKIIIETVSGQRLKGTFFLIDGEEQKRYPSVILLHGSTSNEQKYHPLARALNTYGIQALCVSLRGHGESDGLFSVCTYADGIEDVERIFQWLSKRHEVDSRRIGISGMSMGADQACYLANRYPVASLALRSPATFDNYSRRYAEVKDEEYVYFSSLIRILDQTTLVKNICRYAGPLFVMQSDKDEVIPSEIVDYVYNVCPSKDKQRHLFINARHSVHTDELKNEMYTLTCEWFSKTLR